MEFVLSTFKVLYDMKSPYFDLRCIRPADSKYNILYGTSNIKHSSSTGISYRFKILK
jgi:hypothetical protein